KWKTYQGLTQKTAQRAAQPTTDIFEHKPAQVVTQKRRRSGAEQPNLQGSKMPLDIDNRNNTHIAKAREVVDFYNQTFNKQIRPLDARLDKIITRLKTFSTQEIEQAVINASRDSFFNGGGN